MIIKLIVKALKSLFSFLKKHPKAVITTAAGIGTATAAAGTYSAHKAKKINKKALQIQQEALDKHEREYQATQLVLDNLGRTEKNVIDTFPRYADTIEKIQNRPKFKDRFFSIIKLPNYEPQDIRKLSADFQMVISGLGGAGVVVLAGLAAFGVGSIITAPAMIGTGAVLCIKGVSLKKKAIENKKHAKELAKSVDEIVTYYVELREAAKKYNASISAVFIKYEEYLIRIEGIVKEKTDWKKYNREEKTAVKNAAMLTGFLRDMVYTKLIIQQNDNETLETVNNQEVSALKRKADKLLKNI